jgi:pimeloyl-ACP methyl ester carboxylesterase
VIDELGRIEVPTLVLVGELDEGYHRAAEMMAARIPKAQRVVVPGAGHIVNIEAQAAFDRAVIGFLQGLGG